MTEQTFLNEGGGQIAKISKILTTAVTPLLLVLIVLPASTALAVTELKATADSNFTSGTTSQTTTSGSASASESGTSTTNSARRSSAQSFAEFGILRAYADGSSPLNSGFSASSGSASAYFLDDITINSPGLNATTGSFTFKLTISGNLSATSAAPESSLRSRAEATFWIQKDGNYIFGSSSNTETRYSDGSYVVNGTAFLNQTISITTGFTYGTPFSLQAYLSALGVGYDTTGGNATADISHTVNWDGIAAVYDQANNPVTTYSASSSSGTNYVVPVPEPSTVGFLALGSLLALRRRRLAA